jgi:hypothetical protein
MSRLLDWLNEECCSLMPLAYPTGGGDHDVIWAVIRYQMAEPCQVTIGQGRTATAAIEDAMKDADDPTRWDYVPPQFRDAPRAEKETRVAFCCDINAAHPGKHRGGCPQETRSDPDAAWFAEFEKVKGMHESACAMRVSAEQRGSPADCTCERLRLNR